ncbi:nitrate reductase [Acididesulfobacillus acetoxydans]|uniref:Nitrate reductase n=1 Tax=Acididesulfobacillus acetoxydans TaxID=1561005 RepID=A0A8S0Y2E4_9FIRM|nr:respiratory nitrate reductase subunit gamma [Acididesulfobacillus acetoxydans]CAA7600705.1 nitrate reductase [Acididesulfobacillus acetoxydans]CEJ09486.1 Nitrate reductase gamma chain [Acididesulfobacillus acetoxydans]
MGIFWWAIFPYLMITVFVLGHIYRYQKDQWGWTARSSEFLEKKYLKWGSVLFHTGILLVFGGHVVGMLIPEAVTERLGISDKIFHTAAIITGSTAGFITLAGIVLLLVRRVSVKRVRKTSSFADMLIAVLLFLVVSMGLFNTFGFNLFVKSSFDYRATIAPWIRGVLVFAPDPGLMNNVPLFFRLHIIFAFAIFGVWPFTRLVHVWSVPLEYLGRRSYILYRSVGPVAKPVKEWERASGDVG